MSAAAAALKSQKKALRKAMATRLGNIDAVAIAEQSAAITARVLSLDEFRRSKSVCCYLSMPGGEVDTKALTRAILESGRDLFVPKIDRSIRGRMELLKICDLGELDSLPSGTWGIKEPDWNIDGSPRPDAKQLGVDIMLVPGVAFDRSFSRLGHGMGYYDRYISSYVATERPKPLLVALALGEQVLNSGEVPVDDTDWKMDRIVTSDGILIV